MSGATSNSDVIYNQIVANSIFTPRQISIILNQHEDRGRPRNISSGAYYRQVKQCKKKVSSLLYSIILLQSIGILKPDALVTTSKLAEQLSVIFSLNNGSDVMLKTNERDVMYVINEVIKRMSMM